MEGKKVTFNDIFDLAFRPLVGTAAEGGLEALAEVLDDFDNEFEVFFNNCGVLYNSSAGEDFKQSVARGKLRFSEQEVRTLREVAKYPSVFTFLSESKKPPTFSLTTDTERDLDRKFFYTLMLAAAGRLSNEPNPALSFYDRKYLFYYDNEPLGDILNVSEGEGEGDAKPILGDFEGVLYIRREERASAGQWDLMFGRFPAWGGRQNFAQHVNVWSSFPAEDNVGRAELTKIFNSRFVNVASPPVRVVQNVNLDMDNYGKVMRLYHLIGNVFEIGSFPQASKQWAAQLRRAMANSVPLDKIDGETQMGILLYFFKRSTEALLRELSNSASSVGLRPVVLRPSRLKQLGQEDGTDSAKGEKRDINSLSPSELSKYFDATFSPGAISLLRNSNPLEQGYVLSSKEVLAQPSMGELSSVTWNQKRTYLLWLCGALLSTSLQVGGEFDKTKTDRVIKNMSEYAKEAFEKARQKKSFPSNALVQRAYNEAGMGLFHSLFWALTTENVLFETRKTGSDREIPMEPFKLSANTAGHWAAALLDGGMQAYVDTNGARLKALFAPRDTAKNLEVRKTVQWNKVAENDILDVLAYDLLARHELWKNTPMQGVHKKLVSTSTLNMFKVSDSETKSPLEQRSLEKTEDTMLHVAEALRCCAPIFLLIDVLDRKSGVEEPPTDFLKATTTTSGQSLIPPNSLHVHPVAAYLIPAQISGVQVDKIGRAALRFVAHLLTRDDATKIDKSINNSANKVSAFFAEAGTRKKQKPPPKKKKTEAQAEPEPEPQPEPKSRPVAVSKEGRVVLRKDVYDSISSSASGLANDADRIEDLFSDVITELDDETTPAQERLVQIRTIADSGMDQVGEFKNKAAAHYSSIRGVLRESERERAKPFDAEAQAPAPAAPSATLDIRGSAGILSHLIKGERRVRRAATIVL